MRPDDIDHLAIPGDPQLHPDGTRVAFVLSEVDADEDRYHRTIHLWDGERTCRFTHGPTDSSPRWSPDGRWLALIRKERDDDAKPQLHVMPADGGEAQRRTDLALGITDVVWSPDSRQLVVVGTSWVGDLEDLDDDERRRRPRRITELPYRGDPRGWIHDRVDGLWLVEVTGDADPHQIAPGDRDRSAPAWLPDGKAIAFLSDPIDHDELEPTNQPFEVALDSGGGGEGSPRPIGPEGAWGWVGHAPDGVVHLLGMPDPYDWPGCERVWRCVPDAGGWQLTDLTGELDRDASPGSPPVAPGGPRFVDDGFMIALEGRGRTGIVQVHGSGEVTDVVRGRRCVTGFSVRRDASAVAFTVTDPTTPGELKWLESDSEVALTDLGKVFRTHVNVLPTQRFVFERDGVDLDAWAVLPDGFDAAPEGTVPILFNIHGGPTAQYGDYFLDEFQVGAGAGYLVVGSNPRGSSGRGTDWARAVVGTWTDHGSVDTLDLEAVVDAVVERYPQADVHRVGIMGGSYGGYAAARLLARSQRYRSAIVERGLLNWESFSGTSDIGTYFDRMFLGASLTDGTAAHTAASPTASAARVTTPTLILHSESDWRCPIEQGEQYFVALKRARVPTEMVRFPDEGHELSRGGSPKHRVERFEVVLDWHRRHLATR